MSLLIIYKLIYIDYMANICYYYSMKSVAYKPIIKALEIEKVMRLTLIKKIFVLIFSVIIIVAYIIPPKAQNTTTPFANYFNEFPSAKVFTEIEQTLQLRDGIKIASYNSANEVFITSQNLFDEYNKNAENMGGDAQTDESYLFGFASLSEELIPPTYLEVLSIKGDYAIVVKPYFASSSSTFEDMELRLGVVKFRGENKGDRTDFAATFLGSDLPQIRFVGDNYIAFCNNKDNIDLKVNIITFYDYKSSHKLLEVFKMRADASNSFVHGENNMVAISTDKAQFCRIDLIDEEGFLIVNDNYYGFPEDTDNTLRDYITTKVTYLGNNWFLRQCYIQADPSEINPDDMTYIDGKFILVDSTDAYTGEVTSNYLLMRSDRYNSASKIMLSNGLLVPDMVVNKYNKSGTRDISDYLNNTLEQGIDGKIAYYPPSIPIGELPKDGMSLVYYYYFPYENEPERYVISFVMMDINANIYHPKNNIFFPLLMVDGYGVQISDPDYEMPPDNAQLIDRNNKVDIFKEYSNKEYGYVNIAYSNDALIVAEYNLAPSSEDMFYGAFNKSGKQITKFKYLELSLFYDGYAIGMNKVVDEYRYYRIDLDGKETRLDDVRAIRNGVYVTIGADKVGLKTYAGKVLLDNEYETIDVLETFLVDGKYQRTVITAIKNGRSYIFTIK